MSILKELERKVDLLVEYVTCPESDCVRKESLLLDLKDLKSGVSVCSHESVRQVTEDLLTDMGIPSNLLGYQYLTTAICLLMDRVELGLSICYALYPEVAKKHGSTAPRVERSIRHAIEVSFDRVDSEVMYKYFGGTLSPNKSKATNSEFISRVYQLVERRMEG